MKKHMNHGVRSFLLTACAALAGCTGAVDSAPPGTATAKSDAGLSDQYEDAGLSDQNDAGIPEGCGDGVLATNEVCEGFDLRDETCLSQGFALGTLRCNDRCELTVEESCHTPSDGVATGPEECDGDDFRGETCTSLGFGASGELNCFDGAVLSLGCGECVIGDDSSCASNEVCFKPATENDLGDIFYPYAGEVGTCTTTPEDTPCVFFWLDDGFGDVRCSEGLRCTIEDGDYTCNKHCGPGVVDGLCDAGETCVGADAHPDLVFSDGDGACIELGEIGGGCPCANGLGCFSGQCWQPCDLESEDPSSDCPSVTPTCQAGYGFCY